jgi:hypothetical protein
MKSALFATALVGATVLGGCRGQESEDSPILLLRNMHRQPRYNSQAASTYFEDGRTMRAPVAGTVSRNRFETNEEVESGVLADQSGYVMTIPQEVPTRFGGAEAMVQRGRERFGIYCTPCHDASGSGNGTVVARGYQKPPSLHDARIRQMPDGQVFATISNGVRNMPAYGAQVPVADRWAIVSYVRALELSQLSLNQAGMEPRK